MAGGFGMYARNFLAGQGRYIPDTEKKAPAAQVSATPKHDEGRETRDGITATDVGGGWLLKAPNGKELFVAEETIAALAAQPAARRVTDEDARKAYIAFCTDKPFDPIRAMRAALESFASPAALTEENKS